MSENPFAGIFGDPDGDPRDQVKAAKLEFEAFLSDIREVIDTHVRGFEALGYSREEALYFGGQLHVILTTPSHHKNH